MKKLLSLCLLSVLLYSCDKDDDQNNATPDSSYIKYSLAGVTSQIDATPLNSYPIGRTWGFHYSTPSYGNYYMFNGQYTVSPATVNSDSKYITITVDVDSMITGTTYTNGTSQNVSAEIQDNNGFHFSKTQYAGTNLSVTLTSHNNGLASGFFSGVFQKIDSSGNDIGLINLTNGEFKDIQLVY